ncbi:MAG: permease prefix domain 1-containing protein [Christensenellaceae bacterium]
MEQKLRKYVEELFADAPKTKKALELREEIYTNLRDKYDDLIKSGASPEEAYVIVKRSVGDVSELLGGLEEPTDAVPMVSEAQRKKFAKNTAIAVMLYILSPIAIIVLGVVGQPIIGLTVMLGLIAVATALIVYNNNMRPKYEKMDDTMVEEFKEWKEQNKNKHAKEEAYGAILWPLIIALYFIISFVTGAWYITWVIFIIGAAIQGIIKMNIGK